jgi:hypothetical protein
MDMNGLVSDADVKGHLEIIIALCRGPDWGDFWVELNVPVFEFEELGLPSTAPDSDVWRVCQERGFVLVTGNRNAESATSLERTIRSFGTTASLPVLTFADRDRLLADSVYANRVVARMIELIEDIDTMRGTGRLWLP